MITIGRVYKIVCYDDPNLLYIGSTFKTLNQRWNVHKCHYKRNVGNKSLYKYFDKYGVDTFKIFLIKEYYVYRYNYRDLKHLHSKEQLWINKLNCINIKCSFNPLPKLIQLKIFRDTHKEVMYLRKKKYRDNNKEKIKKHKYKKYVCICGANYTHCHKARHERTKKHMNYINN